MEKCDPKNPSEDVCDHLAHARNVANRLFASSEMKTFGSFIAVSIFLAVAFTWRWNDIGVLKQPIGTPQRPISQVLLDLNWAFICAIVIHHLRVFLGLSYTDSREGPVNDNASRVSLATQRWLRAICTITFPMFSIFLFDDSVVAVLTVQIVWAIQITCIVIYDIFFLKKILSSVPLSWLVIVSDLLNGLFGFIFLFLPFIDYYLSLYLSQASTGVLGAASVIWFTIIAIIIFAVEFIVIYARRVFDNLHSVLCYLSGGVRDAFKAEGDVARN